MPPIEVIVFLIVIGGGGTIAWGLSIWYMVKSLEARDDND
jgi:hypothetical protein